MVEDERSVPFGSPRCTTTPVPAKSVSAARSSAETAPDSLSTTAASSPRDPEATAIATHTPSADRRSDGRATVAAA